MKNCYTLCLGVLLAIAGNAQYFTALTERVEKAKDRILLIEEGDFECNADVETYFKKHWTFGNGVQIKSSDEIDALLTPDDAFKYMVITGDQKMEAKLNGSSSAAVVGMVLYLGENAMIRNELNIDRKFVFKVSFPSCVMTEAEVVFICQHFNNYLAKPMENNQKRTVIPIEKKQSIAKLTLLIPNNVTEMELAAIKKAYKYPVELVAASEIESKILSKATGFAYVNILWSDKRFAWETVVIDCKDGAVLATAKNDYFKAAATKKKWDKTAQPLAICRSKSKLAVYEIKMLNKAVATALEGQ